MIPRRQTALTFLIVAVLVVSLGAMSVGAVYPFAQSSPDEDDDYVVEECIPATASEDTRLEAFHLESANLSTTNLSIHTGEMEPDTERNDTFLIESDRLDAEEYCFARYTGDRDGSRLQIYEPQNENTTISGPNIVTSYEAGEADWIYIETYFSPEELVTILLDL